MRGTKIKLHADRYALRYVVNFSLAFPKKFAFERAP